MIITIRKTSDRCLDFERLVWNVFFQSRNRGISLERHFPWMLEPLDAGFYILAEVKGSVVGGLVVKNLRGLIAEREVKVGMIGLVCVSSDFRGQGISRKILEAALRYARADSFDALTLWTSFSALYSNYGFQVADAWQYGWIHQRKEASENRNAGLDTLKFIQIQGEPVPPFAQSVNQLLGRNSSVFLIRDGRGWIVAGYKGNFRDAAHLMVEKLSDSWRLNVQNNDPLLDELKRIGCEINVNPINLQMWHTIDPELAVSDLVDNIRIPVLERI